MKRNTRKLFSLLLALVMTLSLAVPAFADEGEPPEKELRFAWLMNDGNGFYVEDFVLNSKDNPFEGGLGMSPAGERFAIFFIWNNKTNQRENFVVPKGDGNITVTKLAKDEIAKGAKQTQYYVKLHMNEFKDGEVTANGLSFGVGAALDDFGFYSAATPSVETALAGEIEAAKLTGSALYFCTPYAGEEGRDTISKVEKDPNLPDHAKGYDIEKVKDGLWKITINDVGKIMLKNGGVAVNLKLEVKQPDGNTREDGRSIFVKGEEQAPQLFFVWLDGEWDEAKGQDAYYVSEHPNGAGNGFQVHAGSDRVGMFGTIKDGEQAYTENGFNYAAFTPVAVNSLKTPAGLTVESVSDQAKAGEKLARYFVKVSVDENGKEYKLTSGDYAITVDSGLPDIGVYTAPTASFDTWAGEWGFPYHPAIDNTYYIISTATDAKYGQHLVDAKINPDFPGNAQMSLEKISDDVYKLVFKKDAVMDRESFHVEVDLTWTDFMGNTNTEPNHYFGDFDSMRSILASDTALADGTKSEPDTLEYSAVADQVFTELALNVGEKKEVYLYASRFFGSDGAEPSWKVWPLAQHKLYHSTDPALTIAEDEKDFSRFTVSANKPGTYEIWLGGESWDYENIKLTHANGTPYTEAETKAWHEGDFYIMVDSDGKMLVWDVDQSVEDAVAFEEYFNGDTYELKSLGVQDYGWRRLTVTVTGEAKTFVDVKESDWFYNEVNWAVAQGIANGTGTDTFSPLDDCTHAHILTFLWRAAGEPESEAKLPFTAKNSWAADALAWAYEQGMIDGTLDENAKCTSADAVMYIWQAKGKPAAEYDGRFTDVAKDAAYAQAVAWALDAGVTNGNGVGTFGPATVCSRGRIVTFLYRAFQ